MPVGRSILYAVATVAAFVASPADAGAASSSMSPRLRNAVDLGRSTPLVARHVVVGLSLTDRPGLDALLADLRDPASERFRHFLTPEEFAAYAPPPEAEAMVVAHLEASGLTVTERFSNRLLVGAVGSTAAVERAFGVEIHDVVLEGARHFAATSEPVLPGDVAEHVAGVLGLDDVVAARPHLRVRHAAAPRATLGRDCCHFSPADVQAFYDIPATPDGSGQTLVIAGVYAWKEGDVAAFDREWGLPDLPAGSGQVCAGGPNAAGCRFHRRRSLEVSFADLAEMYDRIVTDDPGHVVSTSWGACEANVAPAVQEIDDEIFASAGASGQAWFAASGDHGGEDCRGEQGGHHQLVIVDHPANSPHVVGVEARRRCAARVSSPPSRRAQATGRRARGPTRAAERVDSSRGRRSRRAAASRPVGSDSSRT